MIDSADFVVFFLILDTKRKVSMKLNEAIGEEWFVGIFSLGAIFCFSVLVIELNWV